MLRPAQIGKQIGTTILYEYQAANQKCIVLLQIPEWLKDAPCSCKNKAKFLLEDLTPICSDCILKQIKKCDSSLNTKSDLSVPLTVDVLKRQSFEWSVDGGDKWYRVHGRNIVIDGDKEEFLRQIKDSLLNKSAAQFEAEYDKDIKIMTLMI